MSDQDDKMMLQKYLMSLNPSLSPSQDDSSAPIPYRNGYDPNATQAAAPVSKPIAAMSKPTPDSDQPGDDVAETVPEPQKSQTTPSVKDYLMKKYGFGDDLSDSAMKDAQDQGAQQRYMASLGAAGNTIGAALGGTKVDNSFYDNMKAQSGQGVADINARRAGLSQGLQNSSAIQNEASKMDMDDPNSAQSKTFQATVAKLYPGKYTPEELAVIPASMADSIYKPMEIDAKIQERKEATAARIQQSQLAAQAKGSEKQNQVLMGTGALLEQMRGSPAVAQAEKDLYNADKANALFGKYKDPNQMNNAEVQLYATEIAKIASGGVPTSHELQGLTPSTIPSNLAKFAEKFTNSPSPANAGAFMKNFKDYSDMLQKDAQKVIVDRYNRIIEPRKALLGEANYGLLKDQYINRFQVPAQSEQEPSQSNSSKPAWAK